MKRLWKLPLHRTWGVWLCLAGAWVLSACRSTQPAERAPMVHADVHDLCTLARRAWERGQASVAAGLYERALQRARGLDDAGGILVAATGLAVCRLEIGDSHGARRAAAEARWSAQRLGSDESNARLLEARALAQEGRHREAASVAREVLTRHSRGPLAAMAAVIVARDALLQNDEPTIRAMLDLARRAALADSPAALRASIAEIQAMNAAQKSDWPAAAVAWEEAARQWSATGRASADVVRCLAEAARAHDQAGERGAAAAAWYRAAVAAPPDDSAEAYARAARERLDAVESPALRDAILALEMTGHSSHPSPSGKEP